MERKILLTTALCIAIPTILCAIMLSGCKKQEAIEEELREVPVMAVSRTDSVTLYEKYTATIEGRQDVDIYPQISGKLTRVCVKEGQEVKEGQLLFVVDQVPYQAAVRMAAANVHAAESQVATARLERDSKKALFEGKVISEYELLTAQNALASCEAVLEQARAALVDAKNNLSYTEIKSPTKGVIGLLPYRVGTLVSPEMVKPLTSVSDNSEMWVYFSLSEKELQGLMRRYGSRERTLEAFPPVSLTLSDGSEYSHQGQVGTLSGIVNPQTGAVQVKAIFPNPERRLLSGSTGNIVMPHSESDVILIPKNATYEVQDKIFAYLAKNGIAESVEITVSPVSDGSNYIVHAGVQPGDTIVTEGVGSLRDGQQIKTREAR